MKITVDLEAVDASKQDWLLNTLNYAQIPFEEAIEEEWDEETIKEYNSEIDEAGARIEAGDFLTMEEVQKEIEKWQ